MSQAAPPDTFSIPLADMIQLATEYWRLSTWLSRSAESQPSAAPARHALRKLEQFLTAHSIEARSLDGAPFDPGLAARVIDTIDDPSLPPGTARVEETLTPMVLWRGQVIRPAEIVTRNATRT